MLSGLFRWKPLSTPNDTEAEIDRWQTALDNCHTEIRRLLKENIELKEENTALLLALKSQSQNPRRALNVTSRN